MSRAYLYGFKQETVDGEKQSEAVAFATFQNSWGGAALVWSCVFDEFFKDPARMYDSWMARPDVLWTAHKMVDRVPACVRAVHASTYDRALVLAEHFLIHADNLEAFCERYKSRDATNGVNHLPDWAAAFRDAVGKWDAIGLYATSCAQNPWWVYGEGDDEGRPYDLGFDEDHFSVYETGSTKVLCGRGPDGTGEAYA